MMDKEQEEFQFLGFFGIFNESISIISSWKKIFSQITLAIILPLSLIFLAHIEISEFLFSEILQNEDALDYTQPGTQRYANLSNMISSEWSAFWLFKITYFIFFLILSLLSTSAVVYTIACIYTAKDVTFKKVMSVVPKVWKRLMVTFIWNFIIVFAYNIVALILYIFWDGFVGPSSVGTVIFAIFMIIYLMGFVYISVIWHLACVISVLEEDHYGIQAIMKSKTLIKGKIVISTALFLVLTLCFIGIQLVFERYVVDGEELQGIWRRMAYGIFCFLVLSISTLFALVVQTVIYFVCKSYHHENIDKTSLADHLEVYLGEYVPLKSKDVQLEQF